MSKLSLCEIKQSQLDKTPVINGQLIVCLDTGNTYRDSSTAHVKIGSDLEVVSELPLAPLVNKIYFLMPDRLYIYSNDNWMLLNEDFKLSTVKSAENGNAKIILDGSKVTSIGIKGTGATTVVTDESGSLVINTTDPNKTLEVMTNSEIDDILSK